MTQEKPRSSKSKTPTLVSDSDSDQPILSDASLSSCPASSSSSEIEGRSCFPLDSVDNLVKSIRNTMGCEESKGAQTAQEIMFAGLADRKRRCFPVIPAVKTLIKREWEKQDQRGFLPSASKRKYPFSDEELLTWTKVPKVDAAVASTSKQSTLPVEDAGLLVDPLDRKAESSLKRSWEAATGIFKPAVASTCAARSMIIWIDQLDQQIEKKSSREKLRAAIPLIRGAAAFLADASADSLRLAARSAGLVNNARRALWMKSWKGDAQSKSKICAIPCEGEPLRGGRLAKGGKQIGLQHGPLRTTSREVPCLEDPTPQKTTNTEDIPVGGRLKFFTTQWEKITSSSWVLNIVRDGIKLKFSRVPHESYIITTLSSPIQQQALELEIQTLISKRVLVQVPMGQEGRGFYSPLFLISKPDGSFRTIINLKKLNSFIENYTFKMESIRSTIKLLFPNCMMGGIDLKDAYYHLPIHNRYQKFLRVAVKINNEVRHFQYAALPFGLSTAPRIFTKIMLEDLGWIINTDKSRLTPLSRQAFLGFQLDSISQKCLLPQIRGKDVRVLSDNTTTVAYLNRQGGTRSETLMSSATEILNLAESHLTSLTALHIRGASNQQADFLSRHTLRQGEWCLNQQIFLDIISLWGRPQIDLFATRKNRKVRRFASLSPADHPDILDALQAPWQFSLAYAFPPIILLPQVIRKIREEGARVVLIAPFWPKRPWFSWLQTMSVSDPWVLPSTPNLLFQGPFFHPQVDNLHLTAWNLRGRC
ncbi:uncharacterized protein LOC143784335 isoform X4 [Ranitomeya variabilis]|uniref:uncharacterized protein LOC143784329 isoform X4 n=1 Tax=Ranitomeya variabilis TaxID=490064 RepID=UPI0040568352